MISKTRSFAWPLCTLCSPRKCEMVFQRLSLTIGQGIFTVPHFKVQSKKCAVYVHTYISTFQIIPLLSIRSKCIKRRFGIPYVDTMTSFGRDLYCILERGECSSEDALARMPKCPLILHVELIARTFNKLLGKTLVYSETNILQSL